MEDNIQKNLTERLETYKLKDRIVFEDSALEELRKRGDWNHVEFYAAMAILNALQSKKEKVTGEEIKAVNIAEMIILMTGGKDPWDDVRYITSQDIEPEGIELRRALNLFDADRNRDTLSSKQTGRLPKYALLEMITYSKEGSLGPEIKIPFIYDPTEGEVEVVAYIFRDFISKSTNEALVVEEAARIDALDKYFGPKFFIKGPDEIPYLHLREIYYSVTKTFPFGISNKAQGVVVITRERSCKHPENTLEDYLTSIMENNKGGIDPLPQHYEI